MKKLLVLCCMMTILASAAAGCGAKEAAPATTAAQTEAAAETTDAVTEAVETTEAVAAAEEQTTEEVTAHAGAEAAVELEDGVYLVDFNTDSSMFHVNEAYAGKGTLIVENGKMTLHVSLTSKNIVNLYLGLASDAPSDEANWLIPTEDEVTYQDGYKETVNGFDIPVEKLDEEFNLALIGKKAKWYDHKVSVSNPVQSEE